MEWKERHNDELLELRDRPDIVQTLKSRRFRWARHVVKMREERTLFGALICRLFRNVPLSRPMGWAI